MPRNIFAPLSGERSDTGGDSSICGEWMMAISRVLRLLISVCGCTTSPAARLLISVWTAIALSALRLLTQISLPFRRRSVKGAVIYSFIFPRSRCAED